MAENMNVEELQEDLQPETTDVSDPVEETTEELQAEAVAEESEADGPLLAAAKAITAQRSRRERRAAPMPDREQALQEFDSVDASPAGDAERSEQTFGRSNANDVLPIIEQLRVSRKRHWILTGMIVSVEPNGDQMCAIIMEGTVKIVIPCSEFFDAPPVVVENRGQSEDAMKKERMQRESTLMANYLGTTVSYIVTDLRTTSTRADRGVYAFSVIASRKLALSETRKRRFAPDARNPISVGSKLTGTILAVSYNTLRICVEGVDKTLYKANITNRYIDDLHSVYHNGENIDVIVTKLERDANGELRDVEFSARAVENEEQRTRFNTLTVNSKVLAKVKAIRSGNSGRGINYILDIPAYAISASAQSSYVLGDNMSGRPQLGDNVLFLVKEITDSGVVGVIIRKL